MNTTASISGIPITLNYKNMSESVHLWLRKLVLAENPNKNYIFTRIMHDDTVIFYTEEGEPFYNERMKLPAIMHFDKLLVGVVYANSQNKDSDFAELTVKLFANPNEDDESTSELARFRKEMILKYG